MELESIDDLVDLESRFYDEGYKQGFEHGKAHGEEEGRELGAQKAFELWEELGYYEGFATFWLALLERQGKSDSSASSLLRLAAPARSLGESRRAIGQLTQLNELINTFPMTNDSSSLAKAPASVDEDDNNNNNKGLDLTSLLASIRSKYRTACATLGVRPRPKVASSTDDNTTDVKMLANEI